MQIQRLLVFLSLLISTTVFASGQAGKGTLGFGGAAELFSGGKASAGLGLNGLGIYGLNDVFSTGVFIGYHPFNTQGYRVDMGASLAATMPGTPVYLKLLQLAAYHDGGTSGVSTVGYGLGGALGLSVPQAGYLHINPEFFYKAYFGSTPITSVVGLAVNYLIDF